VMVRVGRAGDEIVKLKAFEGPPPGAGLFTVTLAAPADAMSVAKIEAIRFVALLKVVTRSDPFQRTVEPATKLEPLTVRAKVGSPAFAEVGLIPLIDGTGFLTARVSCLVESALGLAES
jgi:hypothetical protein